MIPIAFRASSVPCEQAMNPAAAIGSLANTALTRAGRMRRQIRQIATTTSTPAANPAVAIAAPASARSSECERPSPLSCAG
jgi:hypothetical protein